MKVDRSLYDVADEKAEHAANARAEASAQMGRTVSHGAVMRWLESWGMGHRLPRPFIGE